MIAQLQAIMADDVGPLRTGARLRRALAGIAALTAELGERPAGRAGGFDLQRLEWFDLRNMLTVARAVAESALNRCESRGAHQREDFPETLPDWQVHQRVRLDGGALVDFRRAGHGRGRRFMSDIAKLKIRRGTGPAAGRDAGPDAARWEIFEVPFEPGQSVLDGLRWLRIQPGPVARGALFLHQRQRLQGVHDPGRRRNRLCLHRAA